MFFTTLQESLRLQKDSMPGLIAHLSLSLLCLLEESYPHPDIEKSLSWNCEVQLFKSIAHFQYFILLKYYFRFEDRLSDFYGNVRQNYTVVGQARLVTNLHKKMISKNKSFMGKSKN